MSQFAVVGAGSVGAFFAAHLQLAGKDVVSCVRRPFDRYVIESDTAPADVAAHVLTDPGEVTEPASIVIVGVKAHQTAGAAGWLEALCGPSTTVVVAQNGIEHDRVVPYVNGAEVVPTVVYCGAQLLEPGRVAHESAGFLMVPEGPTADRLVEAFAGSQGEIVPRSDFITQMWRKLGINVVGNGLTALTGRPMGVIGEPALRPVAEAAFAEVWTVAAAEGADLDPGTAPSDVDTIVEVAADAVTSMLQDVRAGRPTEHDGIHGALLRRAARQGIDVPTVAAIHGILDTRLP